MGKADKDANLSPDLILEQIVEDFTARLRKGERPAIKEYVDRHPDLKIEIDELLSSAAMIEELKASRGAETTRPDMSELSSIRSIGDYDLIRELGRGGMGVVFEGVHRSLGRRVAIKIVPRHLVENENYLIRFEREAQAAASLHHTNIVSVFGVGNSDGHRYYVMEYIPGENLSEVIWQISHGPSSVAGDLPTSPENADQTVQAQTLTDSTAQDVPAHTATLELSDPTEFTITVPHRPVRAPNPRKELASLRTDASTRYRWAAKLIMQVADALSYAHQQGILHRDIKPSNLILDADQRVWVTDFGLVKDLTDQSLTKTGDIVGTIQYMAPEAFEGKYDVRSETYSLGLTLYELVCLRPAFANTSTPELIRQIVSDSHKIQPFAKSLPRDLQTIIAKSISRDVSVRYESATDLRDDLRAFLEDRPIQARRPGAIEILQKWAKRNPLVASLTMAIGLLLLTVAIVATTSYRKLRVAYQDVLRQKEKTREEFSRAETNLQLTIEAFDTLYRNILYGENATDKTIVDGLRELSGIKTVVTEKDAGLLKSMLAFYDRFATENENSPKLELETSRALRRVANINRLLGEVDEAIAYYEKAVEKFEKRLNAPDHEPEQSVQKIIDYVRVNNEYALALQQKGQYTKFRERFEASQKVLETQVGSASDSDHLIQLELARTFNLMGANATRFAAARSTKKARFPLLWQLGQRLNRQQDSNDKFRRTLPMRRNLRDTFESRMTEWQKLRFNEKAAKILKSIQSKDPENPEIQLELAKCYTLLASKSDRSNKKYLTKSIKILETLLKEDPDDPEIKFHLALSCVIPNSESTKNSFELLDTAEQLITEMTDRYPLILEYQQVAVIVRARKADAYISSGDLDLANSELESAESLLQNVAKETPSTVRLSTPYRMLANLYLNLALEYQLDGNGRAYNDALRQAARLHPATQSFPKVRRRRPPR